MNAPMPSGDPCADVLKFAMGHVFDAATVEAYTSSYGSFWLSGALQQRGFTIGERGVVVRRPHEVPGRVPFRHIAEGSG